LGLIWETGHAQDIGAREEQQDAYGFGERGAAILAVMADGMGGHAGGAAAAEAAVQALLSPDVSHLADAVRAAQQSVRDMDIRGAGSTLVAASCIGNRVEWASLGDSAILHRQGRELRQLNTPHVFGLALAKMAESGKISWAEAAQHPEKDALTHYLGMPGDADAEYGSLQMSPGERLVLASDGLTNALRDDEIRDRMYGSPQEICDELLALVLSKKLRAQDNVTILCLGLASAQSPTRRVSQSAESSLWLKFKRVLGKD
jgi:protein phosphatase